MMQIPEVEDILTKQEVLATANTIKDLQLDSGMIPWVPGGHCDPWNHVESAMALSTCGLSDEAEMAYQWLADSQRPDGSWHNYYVVDGIEDSKLDSNCVAYIATGVWHHYLATGDISFLKKVWPVVDRAVEFVLELQTRRGEIVWARHADGTPWSYALLTGSSSISHSLQCAWEIAQALEQPRDEWAAARQRLVETIVNCPEAFEPKDRWAMDWYYPVLSGAINISDGAKRLSDGFDTFVMEGKGVRCVSDRPWVTAAETCECALAHLAVGETETATKLFAWAQSLRADAGGYFTGIVFPELVHFPADERTSYTAAAIILTTDALYAKNPTSSLFTVTPSSLQQPLDSSTL